MKRVTLAILVVLLATALPSCARNGPQTQKTSPISPTHQGYLQALRKVRTHLQTFTDPDTIDICMTANSGGAGYAALVVTMMEEAGVGIQQPGAAAQELSAEEKATSAAIREHCQDYAEKGDR